VEAKLYVVIGSHPCKAGMLLLEHKRIPYRKVTLPTGGQRLLRLAGWPGITVPALVLDGERVQTTRAIARRLETRKPDPPLYPSDPGLRRAVDEAERWSDEVLQMVARRLAFAGSARGLDTMHDRGRSGPLGPLLYKHDVSRALAARLFGRLLFNVNARTERRLLDELPAQLDKIDAWIEQGVLGGDRLNAADYLIVSNLALLTYRLDLRDGIAERPAGRLVERVLGQCTGLADRAAACSAVTTRVAQ
jgi:glutathione S-transferase